MSFKKLYDFIEHHVNSTDDLVQSTLEPVIHPDRRACCGRRHKDRIIQANIRLKIGGMEVIATGGSVTLTHSDGAEIKAAYALVDRK
jgi:hypothetical protein